jgi:hypothetical protein
MKKFFFAFVFLFFMASPAAGQSMQSFVHDFGEYKVYHTFGQVETVSFVESAKFVDGVCRQVYTSPVKFKSSKVVFRGGTVWKIEKRKNGLFINTPVGDGNLYKPAKISPMKLCRKEKRDV